MTPYFAVFKLVGAAVGTTASYEAEGVSAALKHLCMLAKQKGTEGFSEYEIYEVIGDRKYRSVAIRLPPGERAVSVLPAKKADPPRTEKIMVRYPVGTI